MRKAEQQLQILSHLTGCTALLFLTVVAVGCKTKPSVPERTTPTASVALPSSGLTKAVPPQPPIATQPALVTVANPNLFASVPLPDGRGYLIGGSDGQILRSDNEGSAFEVVKTDTNAPLFGVGCHPETQVCLAYGADGVVLRSTDLGKHFARVPLAATLELRAMSFGSAAHAKNGSGQIGVIVVGERGGIYTSRDDGATFAREESGSTAFLGHVVSVPAEGAWLAAGERGEVLRSLGDGRWHRVTFPSDQLITSLHVSSAGHVFAGDEGGCLFRSTNGGQSFGRVWGPAPEAFVTSMASDPSGKLLLAATRAGRVLRSSDGGERFEAVALETKAYLSRVMSLGTKGFLVLGNEGTLYQTSADLNTYRRLSLQDAGDLEASAYEPKTDAWVVVGKGGFIARSSSTTRVPATLSQALLRHMNGVTFEAKRGALVAVGTDEGALRSIDGGKSWQNVPLPVADGTTMFSIAASEKTGTLIASGTGSALLRSTDGGSRFVATRGASGSLSTVHALSDGSFLTAPVDEGVLRSSDDGKTWTPSKMDPGISVVTFAQTAAQLIAVGLKGALFYSVDQGRSFVRSESDTDADLRAVAVTPRAVVVVGATGTVLRSTDGGRRFSPVAVDTTANLLSVTFHPTLAVVVAVGNDGTILSSFDDGASWLKTDAGGTERLRLVLSDPSSSQIVVIGHAGALLLSRDGRQFSRFTSHTRAKLGAYTYHPPTRRFVLVGERMVGLQLLPAS